MTKAELIKRIAKNVGVPDTDAKIFFELFLKRISAVVEIGQSIFVQDFGYFHLIKGSIKKPVFSFKDNEVTEEAVELVLFSEDKDLRKSDTKGLVFNIPYFDEEDYHPIDSSFSLSIGKPLIPLRGVPFDNIYIPTSGYEYRRLLESKVEKIIAESLVAESVENFPVLVIDARSYNSNSVQLLWEKKSEIDIDETTSAGEVASESKPELTEYEKQTNELKNIAWDFGEGLSKHIEAESILDIAGESINKQLNQKPLKSSEAISDQDLDKKTDELKVTQENIITDNDEVELEEFIEDEIKDESSEKLKELLESETQTTENIDAELIEDNILEKFDTSVEEVEDEIEDEINENIEEEKPAEEINLSLQDELSDEEFWKSTSKYFEPYKPGLKEDEEEENIEEVPAIDNLSLHDSINMDLVSEEENDEVLFEDSNLASFNSEPVNKNQEMVMDENHSEKHIELEVADEKKAEYFEPVKKKNLVPFILFPLLVITLSLALYWYLEFYKKGEITFKPKQIVLKSDNAKFVERDFGIPVTYPYLPRVNATTLSETLPAKNNDPVVISEETANKKLNETNTEVKSVNKENVKPPITETKNIDKNLPPTGNALNVGNNIFKYGNFYAVQVASFRASSISENEAGKYRNKGFNAFVEEAEIPNRGKWYRVRVGNFSSKDEAQSFVDKNIR